MNGRPPSPPQAMAPPPSVQRARRQPSYTGRRAWSGFGWGRILLALVALVVLTGVAIMVYLYTEQQKAPKGGTKTAMESLEPFWGKQTFDHTAETPAVPAPPPPPEDKLTPELARLRAELAATRHDLQGMKGEIVELRNRKPTTTVIQQGGQQASTPKPVARAVPAPLLYVQHDLSKDKLPPRPKADEYVLAAYATYIPCTIQPLMNSDVPGQFTAKVNQNVYDTKTGQHLLVPQGATIGGVDRGEVLLFGNERLPTFALALTIEDRTYELDAMPVTDHLGTNGLTGDVDNHWWRLFGAIFIGGALRGGQQLLQMEVAQAAGAGQVATGIAAVGNNVAQQRVGRALDTRPTIRVFPGQGCQVLLTKSLTLPAVWQ